MGRTETTVWHVTPESNIEDIQEEGLQPRPCIATWLDTGDPTNPERVKEGVYVARKRRTIEAYVNMGCLRDVEREMDDDEQFALFKATVDVSRLTTDPESDTSPSEPSTWIHAGAIEDPELVTVGL